MTQLRPVLLNQHVDVQDITIREIFGKLFVSQLQFKFFFGAHTDGLKEHEENVADEMEWNGIQDQTASFTDTFIQSNIWLFYFLISMRGPRV